MKPTLVNNEGVVLSPRRSLEESVAAVQFTSKLSVPAKVGVRLVERSGSVLVRLALVLFWGGDRRLHVCSRQECAALSLSLCERERERLCVVVLLLFFFCIHSSDPAYARYIYNVATSRKCLTFARTHGQRDAWQCYCTGYVDDTWKKGR